MKGRFSEADILMEDSEILVVHKHAGMAVQSARAGQMDLEHELYNYLVHRAGEGMRRPPYLAVIHRLDQPVQGFWYLEKPWCGCKAEQTNAGKQDGKEYLAVVRGKLNPPEGVLIDYLVKDEKTTGRKSLRKAAPAPDVRSCPIKSWRPFRIQETEMVVFSGSD